MAGASARERQQPKFVRYAAFPANNRSPMWISDAALLL